MQYTEQDVKARRYTALPGLQKGLPYLKIAFVKMLVGILGWFLKYIMKLKKKKGLNSKKKRDRKTCLNLLRLSKKELKSDLIKVCRYLHKEEISDNK